MDGRPLLQGKERVCLGGCVYNTEGPEATGSCSKWQEGASVCRIAPIGCEYVFLVLFLISLEKLNFISRVNSCKFISMANFNWEEVTARRTWGAHDPESLFYFTSLVSLIQPVPVPLAFHKPQLFYTLLSLCHPSV